MEKSKSSLLSSSIFCVRQMVLRVGFKFKLTMVRVRTPAPSRLLLALLAGYGVHAMALPTGGQVASGNVAIGAPANGSLNITQTTNKGVVNWQSFNVASGESVNFVQPGATSSTLNRVIGSDPTSIFGQINANGQVFLINNSGILFGAGAQVNAAGLVASTLSLADSDYLSGNYSLTGATGSVDNQGVLKAGFVALAGAQVSNTGTIVVDGGTAALVAGGRVTLNLTGSDLVSVSVDAPTAAALVHSGGIVQADGGQVLISAKAADALLGTVVNVDGIVQAHSIGSRNGVITLDGGSSGVVDVTGKLDASGKGAGQTGGTVRVVGANVGLFDATVDASGDAGGGVVRVGGDWHGAGADGDANASQTIVAGASVIDVNAISSGNGGNVVLWSQDKTKFTGAITARGGAAGGNGGNVETSAHDVLQATGSVDLSAAAGLGGMWLIDPNNITIATGSNSNIVNGTFTSNGDNAIVSAAALSSALTNGAVINVITSNGGAQTGNITVTGSVVANLSGGQSATLNLDAAGSVTFTGGSIGVSGSNRSLTVNVNAGTDVGNTNTPGTNFSTFSMDGNSSISTGASGDLNITTKGTAALGKIAVGGNFEIDSNGGAVSQLVAGAKNVSVGGLTTINAGAAGITLNNASNSFTGAVSLNNSGAGNVLILANTGLTFGNAALGTGTFQVQTLGGDITQANNTSIVQAPNAGAVGIGAGGNAILLGNANNDFTGAVSLTNSNNKTVTLTDMNSLTLSGMALSGGTNTITAGSAAGDTLTSTGTNSYALAPILSVNGQTPDPSVTSYFLANSATSVSIGATAGTALDLTVVGASILPALHVNGDLTVTAASTSALTQGGILHVDGKTTLNGDAQGINLGTLANVLGGALVLNGSNGGAIVVNATGPVSLGASALGTSALTLTTDGDITQTGAMTQTGAAGNVSFATGAGVITLDLANDFKGAVSLTNTAGDVTLTDANSLTLGAINIANGTNTINAGTTIGDSLTRTTLPIVGAPLVLNVGGVAVSATSLSDFFALNSATSVTLQAAAGSVQNVTALGVTALPTLVVGGDLTLTGAGSATLTQSGNLTVGGNTVIHGAGQGVNLGTNSNEFDGSLTVDTTGGNVSIASNTVHGLALGVTLGTGTLTVNAGNAIAESGAITQTAGSGAVSFNAGGNAITLTNSGNDFKGAVSVSNSAGNGAVAITDVNALSLGTVNVGGGTLGFTATSLSQGSNAITQTGGTGAVTINTGGGAIALGGNNDFLGAVNVLDVTNAGNGNVTINDVNALHLGTVSMGTGTLSLTSNGVLDQTGPVTQGANAGAVTIASGTGAITLTSIDNDFTGVVALSSTSSGAVQITDANAIRLGAISVGTGPLTVTALGGDITQNLGATVTTGGVSTFNAGSGNVTLAPTVNTNTFGGLVTATGTSVDVSASTALDVNATLTAGTGNLTLLAGGTLTGPTAVTTTGDISLTSTGAGIATGGALSGRNLTLSGTTVGIGHDVTTSAAGVLTLDATNGAITQTGGVITANDAASLTATGTAGSNSITLNGANNFVGLVTASGAAIGLTDTNALDVNLAATTATLHAAGALIVDGTTSSDLSATGVGITFGTPTGTTTVHGNLSANSGAGDIVQADTLAVIGTSALTAGGLLTLGNSANSFGGAITTASGTSVDILANSSLGFTTTPAIAASGSLTLAANGTGHTLILPAGSISTTGNVSLTSAGGLTTGGDITAASVTLGGGAISIANTINATTFNASSSSTISETSAGNILATGATTLNAGANAVTLNTATNDFNTVSVTGGAVSIVDANAVTVHLTNTTSANLTASGANALTVDGQTTGGDLTLSGDGIVFGSIPANSTSVHGNLVANSGAGTITQAGALAVTGTSGLTAVGQAITLSGGNDFGGLATVTGGAVTLNDTNDLQVHLASATNAGLSAGGLLTVDGATSGSLTTTSTGVAFGATTVGTTLTVATGAGPITQSGVLSVTGATGIGSTGSVTLGAANDFQSPVTASGTSVTLTNAGALTAHVTATDANVTATAGALAIDGTLSHDLTVSGAGISFGATSVANALSATSTGAITETGTLSVTGTSGLNAGANAITLTGNNNFGDLVTAQGDVVQLNDINAMAVALTSATSATLNATGMLTVSGATTTGNLDATGNGVTFGAGVTSVGGTLHAVSGTGDITQAGSSVIQSATTTLDGGSHAVTLTNGNHFGMVTVNGGAVGLTDVNAMTIHLGTVASATLNAGDVLNVDGATVGALSVTGNGVVFGATTVGDTLSATISGAGTITQTGTLAVTNSSTLNAGSNAIALSTPANNFGGAVTATGGTVALTDTGALAVHLLNAGSATLVAGTQLAIDGNTSGPVSATGNGVVFAAAGTTVGGALDAHSGSGSISQAGSLGVTGATLLDAGVNDVAMTSNLNNLMGLVTVNGGSVALSDGGAMSVHLNSVNNASLIAAGALAVDGATAAGLAVSGLGVAFGATSVGGALTATTINTSGAITQSGAIGVTGTTTLNGGASTVALANPLNDFGGAVTVSGGPVSLADSNTLTAHLASVASATLASTGALTVDGTSSGALTASGAGIVFGSGATNVGGALSATSTGGGTIAQAGALQVTGASMLTAGIADITLASVGDHFGGLVTATGGAVALSGTGSLAVHLASTTSANLTAASNLTVDGATSGNLSANGASVKLGAAGTTVGGALVATASTGDITQSGTLAVTGTSALSATAGAITLANPANDFGGLVTAGAGGALSLADVNDLGVHIASATNATLASGGVLTVDGSTSGALQATGSGVVFGATTVGGALTANASGGTVSQTGSLAVVGASMLNAGTGAVTLNTPTNDFGGAVTVTGGTVKLADANTLTAHLASTGNTTLTAAGLLAVDGASTGGLTANGNGVVFGPGSTHVAGALASSSGAGSITQSGALVVGGASTLDAGTNAITLTNAGNDFGDVVSTTGGGVALTDVNALSVHLANATTETLNAAGVLEVDGSTAGTVTANGNGVVFGATTIGGALFSASGAGTITQTGALAVTGATTLNAGINAITLTNAANDFTGAVTATGGAVGLADANAMTAHVAAASAALSAGGLLSVDGSTTGALAANGAGISFGPGATTVHGALTAFSSGAVTQSGDLAVIGATTITATGQAVTLARQSNALAGGVSVAAAAADIEQAGALTAHLSNVGSAIVESRAALAVDGSSTGNVTATGASVTFGSGASAVGGNLAATSTGGDMTQAGVLAVTGTSVLHAGTGNVALGTSGNALSGAVTVAGANVALSDSAPLTVHVAANGSATLTSAGALTVDGSGTAMVLNGTAVNFGAAGTTVNGALTVTGTGVTQAGALAVTGLSEFNAGAGDILLDSPGTNLQSTITATGRTIRLTDLHAIDATLTASGDVTLSSTAAVSAHGTFHGGLKATGANVSVAAGTSAAPTVVSGALDVTSTGSTTLGDLTAGGASVNATGTVLLGGTLASSGDVTLRGSEIQGVLTKGALDVAAGSVVSVNALSGNIGKAAATSTGAIDDQSIIALKGATGQSGLYISFNAGQSAWFRVSSQVQTHQINPHQLDSLRAQTFFCDTQTCVNVLGQTTAIADSVISNILSAASQDAADAAFGTENLDFAIRKGYVTTIGRVSPGIDEIAGDLGATQCDSRVTSPTAVAADKACSAGAKAGK